MIRRVNNCSSSYKLQFFVVFFLFVFFPLFREQKYFDPEMDLINNGRIGDLIMGKEGIVTLVY